MHASKKSRKLDESGALALIDMVDRSGIEQALLLADRNYESYNNLAHIQEKGWYFLIRIKDNTKGIVLFSFRQALRFPKEVIRLTWEYFVPVRAAYEWRVTEGVETDSKSKRECIFQI